MDEKLNVTVDGQSCGDLASRDKILKVQNENNVVLSFDEVASANKEKIRELLQKKKYRVHLSQPGRCPWR